MGDIKIIICTIVITVVGFWLLREFFCWYWKINESLDEQKKTNELLSQLLKNSKVEKNGNSTEGNTETEIKADAIKPSNSFSTRPY